MDETKHTLLDLLSVFLVGFLNFGCVFMCVNYTRSLHRIASDRLHRQEVHSAMVMVMGRGIFGSGGEGREGMSLWNPARTFGEGVIVCFSPSLFLIHKLVL